MATRPSFTGESFALRTLVVLLIAAVGLKLWSGYSDSYSIPRPLWWAVVIIEIAILVGIAVRPWRRTALWASMGVFVIGFVFAMLRSDRACGCFGAVPVGRGVHAAAAAFCGFLASRSIASTRRHG